MKRTILGLGSLQVLLSTLAIFLIALLLKFSWNVSLAIGLILSLSSTAIVLQTLNEKGLLTTQGGRSGFSVLLFQDISLIPILALLPLLALSVDPELLSHSSEHGQLPLWNHSNHGKEEYSLLRL